MNQKKELKQRLRYCVLICESLYSDYDSTSVKFYRFSPFQKWGTIRRLIILWTGWMKTILRRYFYFTLLWRRKSNNMFTVMQKVLIWKWDWTSWKHPNLKGIFDLILVLEMLCERWILEIWCLKIFWSCMLILWQIWICLWLLIFILIKKLS